MNHSTVNILALCDKMLLAIFNKLNNIDVLYSLIGVNQKLDRLARDISFTQSIDLLTLSSNKDNHSRTNQYYNDSVLTFCLQFDTTLNVLLLIRCQYIVFFQLEIILNFINLLLLTFNMKKRLVF
jgi:hypothetical protein